METTETIRLTEAHIQVVENGGVDCLAAVLPEPDGMVAPPLGWAFNPDGLFWLEGGIVTVGLSHRGAPGYEATIEPSPEWLAGDGGVLMCDDYNLPEGGVRLWVKPVANEDGDSIWLDPKGKYGWFAVGKHCLEFAQDGYEDQRSAQLAGSSFCRKRMLRIALDARREYDPRA